MTHLPLPLGVELLEILHVDGRAASVGCLFARQWLKAHSSGSSCGYSAVAVKQLPCDATILHFSYTTAVH